MWKAEENGICERYGHSLGCRNRVETDFCADLGDREASASTGIELSHPEVAAPAGRTPVRRI
jgi:hypothetical protein